MPAIRTGGCLCTKVRYTVGDEDSFTIRCYCRDCQHISGGGHAVQFAVGRSAASLSGPVRTHRRKSDAGRDVEVGFCGECGSPIYKTTSHLPHLILFLAGSLDEPAGFTVGSTVYEERRQPWDRG